MINVLDILKIQKTIRKAIGSYEIKGKYDEEVLISLVSVDLYLNLTQEDSPTPTKPKTTKRPDIPRDIKALNTNQINLASHQHELANLNQCNP